jgi:hypothetical protein
VSATFEVGDRVDIMQTSNYDAVLVQMQSCGATIAAVVDDGYMVTLAAVIPPDKQYGPFPAHRLRRHVDLRLKEGARALRSGRPQ